MQISEIVSLLRGYGLSVRVGAWEKTNPSPMNGGKIWVSGLEFCVYAKKPKAVFNEHCKKALWQAPSGRAKSHPTEKPRKLIDRLVLASSNPGDVVMDFVMGSGTTGESCAVLGRSFIGVEIDVAFFDMSVDRISNSFDGILEVVK